MWAKWEILKKKAVRKYNYHWILKVLHLTTFFVAFFKFRNTL